MSMLLNKLKVICWKFNKSLKNIPKTSVLSMKVIDKYILTTAGGSPRYTIVFKHEDGYVRTYARDAWGNAFENAKTIYYIVNVDNTYKVEWKLCFGDSETRPSEGSKIITVGTINVDFK